MAHCLASTYQPRPLTEPARLQRHYELDSTLGQVSLPLFHGVEGQPPRPDWLAEIFEWVSGAHELSASHRDSVGRVPYSGTLHGTHQLNPALPYASIAMAGLNSELRPVLKEQWSKHPLPPWRTGHSFALAPSHDIDFLPISSGQAFHRLAKNCLISIAFWRNPRLALQICGAILRRATGDRSPSWTLSPMLARELSLGIRSSSNFIVRRAHRRDANYCTADPEFERSVIAVRDAQGEVGLHGSYTSLLEVKDGLSAEYETLRAFQVPVRGGRQHWLRYSDGQSLIEALSHAGAVYDSTFGFADQVGFRHGAAFPFPPYDFASESAFPLLELPMVLMDVSLASLDSPARSAYERASEIIQTSRKYGWGGVSVLWHDTVFGGGQLPHEIAEVFWKLKQPEDLWIPCIEVVEQVWERYHLAGLVPARDW